MQEEPASSSLKLWSYSTNSLNQTRQYFHITFLIHRLTWWNTFFVNGVRCSNGCWSSTKFVIFEIFTAVLKSCIPLKNPCTRDNIVTISLFYQLQSFGSCFARLETEHNVRPLLHHYKLSQRSTRYKILTRLSMNDKRDVTDCVQRTRGKSQLTRTS
jgi:hypothetical protein